MYVSRQQFEELVADALDGLPEHLGRLMDNVVVLVEDWPTAEQLAGLSGTLLGRYEGVALTNRAWYMGATPDRIYIFRRPLCERAATEEALTAMVRKTVIHEVGHHFGISDDRLTELGWG